MKSHAKQLVLLTVEELAEKLDVTPGWVNYNRNKSGNPIPFLRFNRMIRYEPEAVMQWIGRKDLPLTFFSEASLAERMGVSASYIKKNRLKAVNPIPYRQLGRLVRYNEREVAQWIEAHS